MADFARLESLFFGALAKTEPAERQRYLELECGQDTALRGQVERLIAGQAGAGSFLQQPVAPEATKAYESVKDRTATQHNELLGTLIAGKYKLLEEIGEGGMGTVFVAEQTEPVKRKVAVKLIKPGMDSKSVLARFEAERQALAMMDHPNIARVLDAGIDSPLSPGGERVFSTGRPYFVMEYIKGLPLTRYCDDAKLSIDDRLQLFIQICQAVQHAHQKGIIHRDLKPGNILIALYDGKPVPKVIDFGLAKALHQSLTERTLHTGHEMVIGTPLYMSPEQAELNNLDIDTRSDIYSLGVILYELLTGVTPLEKQRFKEAAWAEVLRIIKEEEPSKPSTKLSQSNSLPSVAAQRQIDPKKLSTLMKGDLDWIVMKALEKDRNRRYETANGFAADVLRYLLGEPVVAAPPSAGYRLKKFVRRHKVQVIAASLVLSALLAGIAGTTWGFFEARRQEGIARDEVLAKEAARADEAKQRAIAEENEHKAMAAAEKEKQAKVQIVSQLKQIELINETVFDIFGGFDIRKVRERGEPVEAVLAKKLVEAGRTLDAKAISDPLVLAKVRNRLGETLVSLGYAGDSIELFHSARAIRSEKLGPDHADTLDSMNNLAVAYLYAGKLDLALPLQEETFRLMKAKFGPDHPETLTHMSNLAAAYQVAGKLDKSLALGEETLKLKKVKLGVDHPETLRSMNILAMVYKEAGKLDVALPLYEETLKLRKEKLGSDHPDTLTSMSNLAVAYQVAGKLNLALPLSEETLKLRKARLGPDHPDTLKSMGNLAVAYRDAGKLELALPLQEETLKLRKAKLGVDHPETLTSMNNLAMGYKEAGKLDVALPLFEETLKLQKAKLGVDHPETLRSMNNLAIGYKEAGKLDVAIPLYEETLKLRKEKLGSDHPYTLNSMNNLADAYLVAKRLNLALPLCKETLERTKAKLGPDHRSTLTSMNNLALAYQVAGKRDLALPLFEETLKLKKVKLGPDHPSTLTNMHNLAGCYWSLKQLDKSVLLFEELLPLREKKLGRDHPDTLNTVANLGVNYKDDGRLTEAIPLLEEAYRASKRIPTLLFAAPQLLDAYVEAGKSAEAKKLIDELLAEARQTLPKDSPQLAGLLVQYGMTLLQMKGYVDAEPLLRECLTIHEKTQPDAWTTFNTQSMLGGALLGQKKYADAEPLLLKGYEGMKARAKTIPPQGSTRIPEALDRLIQFYTETNKHDEAKKWQAEKARMTQSKVTKE